MWFYYLVAYFFIYAFLGWCLEVAYQAVTKGKLINRGFLNGPVCPIYGFGMVSVLIILSPVLDKKWLLFGGGIVIATVIELFGGWALDKMFHMRWWDYSEEPFNLNGYICLKFCILWGITVVFSVKYFHAFISKMVHYVPFYVGVVVLVLCSIAMICDLIVTYKTVIGIKRDLKEIQKVAKTLRDISDNLTEKVGKTALEAAERSDEFKDEFKDEFSDMSDNVKTQMADFGKKYEELVQRLSIKSKRMLKAYPKWHISGQTKRIEEYFKNIYFTVKK
ncbi:MAG: hypothetical protein E7254_04650 [Lachnospiraceae bacterium]|nr:hypothetical protein [Lachnospiraceae bacterium]